MKSRPATPTWAIHCKTVSQEVLWTPYLCDEIRPADKGFVRAHLAGMSPRNRSSCLGLHTIPCRGQRTQGLRCRVKLADSDTSVLVAADSRSCSPSVSTYKKAFYLSESCSGRSKMAFYVPLRICSEPKRHSACWKS